MSNVNPSPISFKLFIIKLGALTLVVGGILLAWNTRMPQHYRIVNFYLIPVYFFITTLLFHIQLLRAIKQTPQKFVYAYLGSTGLRMLLTILIFIAYISLVKTATLYFSVAYLVSYFVYLIFEVVELQRLFRA